jgi:hypothetical protein
MKSTLFILVAVGFFLCTTNPLLPDEPVKAAKNDGHFLLFGPFSLGELFKQSEAPRDLIPEPAFKEIVESFNKCKVSILHKKVIHKSGKWVFAIDPKLVVEGELSFQLKDKAGKPFKINVRKMIIVSDSFDITQNPPTCRTFVGFDLETSSSDGTSTRSFMAPDFRYDLAGKIIAGPTPGKN